MCRGKPAENQAARCPVNRRRPVSRRSAAGEVAHLIEIEEARNLNPFPPPEFM